MADVLFHSARAGFRSAMRHKREFTVDAPSRSALVLAETLERAFGKRKWLSGKRLVGKYNRSDIQ